MSRPALLTFGLSLVLGLAAGLYLGWVVSPVEYVDTAPDSLRLAFKDDYVLMIASAYAQDGNLDAARARLAALGFADPGAGVADAAQRFIAAGQPEADLRRVAQLASALDALTPELQPFFP